MTFSVVYVIVSFVPKQCSIPFTSNKVPTKLIADSDRDLQPSSGTVWIEICSPEGEKRYRRINYKYVNKRGFDLTDGSCASNSYVSEDMTWDEMQAFISKNHNLNLLQKIFRQGGHRWKGHVDINGHEFPINDLMKYVVDCANKGNQVDLCKLAKLLQAPRDWNPAYRAYRTYRNYVDRSPDADKVDKWANDLSALVIFEAETGVPLIDSSRAKIPWSAQLKYLDEDDRPINSTRPNRRDGRRRSRSRSPRRGRSSRSRSRTPPAEKAAPYLYLTARWPRCMGDKFFDLRDGIFYPRMRKLAGEDCIATRGVDQNVIEVCIPTTAHDKVMALFDVQKLPGVTVGEREVP